MKQLTFALCTLLLGVAASADSIYIAPIQSTGVSKTEAKVVRELIISNIQNTKHSVVNTQGQADYFIQSKLIQLSGYTLFMSKWQGNQKVETGQWKAKNSAELENLTQVAVNQLLDGKSKGAASTANLGQKIENKRRQQPSERISAPRQVLFGFGPSYFSNMNSDDSGLGFLLGYFWNISDAVDLGIQTDLAFSTEKSDTRAFSARIMANYFPVLLGDSSPYIGAGFGYGTASAHSGNSFFSDDKSTGFAASIQAGMKFFRTSTVNLGVGLDYTRIFDENRHGNPSRFILNVALYF